MLFIFTRANTNHKTLKKIQLARDNRPVVDSKYKSKNVQHSSRTKK